MTKDEKIAAARAVLDAMGLDVADLAEKAKELTIDDILPVVKQPWVPNDGDEFWNLHNDGRAFKGIWHPNNWDASRVNLGNMFPTREAAEARAQAMRDWEWLRQRSDGTEEYGRFFVFDAGTWLMIPGVNFSTDEKTNAATAYIGPERLENLARWLHNLEQ